MSVKTWFQAVWFQTSSWIPVICLHKDTQDTKKWGAYIKDHVPLLLAIFDFAAIAKIVAFLGAAHLALTPSQGAYPAEALPLRRCTKLPKTRDYDFVCQPQTPNMSLTDVDPLCPDLLSTTQMWIRRKPACQHPRSSLSCPLTYYTTNGSW